MAKLTRSIRRAADQDRVERALRRAPVVLLVGPRQVGKTTLAETVVGPERSQRFDAERAEDLARLSDPYLALRRLDGLVFIDEAQRAPDLFPTLRVLVDEDPVRHRYLIAGSASPDLVGLSAESLAGRVEIVELGGFRVADVGESTLERLWIRGGFPRSLLAANDADSIAWRDSFISTFLERDLGQLGFHLPATTARRAWTMLAHYTGQTWNGAELARALDLDRSSSRRYLDALTDALVVRQLQPWFVNTRKRQVKAPKIYVRDSGLAHRLLSLTDETSVLSHPRVGATWEAFVIEQVAALAGTTPLYFWATHQGAELDLYFEHDGRRVGFDIKRTTAPRDTTSLSTARAELQLDLAAVVHAGDSTFPLGPRVSAVAVADLLNVPDLAAAVELVASTAG